MKQLKHLFVIAILAACLLTGCGSSGGSTPNPVAPAMPTQLASVEEINDNIVGTWRLSGSSVAGDALITMQEYTYIASNLMSAQADVYYSNTDLKQFWDGLTKYQILDGKIRTYDGTVKIYDINSLGVKTLKMEIAIEDTEQVITEISATKMIQFDTTDSKYETYYKQ